MLARFSNNTRGGVAPLVRGRRPPADGRRRRGHRLFAGERRPHGVPGRARFDRLDALERRGDRIDAHDLQTEATNTSTPCSATGPGVPTSVHVTPLLRRRRIQTDADRHRHRRHKFHRRHCISTVNITATSVSTWGNTRLRVALVLDNTGSMASSDKMTRSRPRRTICSTPTQGRGRSIPKTSMFRSFRSSRT